MPVFFCSFLNGLTELYPELFDNDGTPSQLQHNFAKKWRSYATIVELADGDIRRIDDVVNQPLEKCLLLLAFKSDKALLEQMMHEAALNAHK